MSPDASINRKPEATTSSEHDSGSRWSYQSSPANNRALVAEFIATALLVYVGCGTAVSSQSMLGLNPDDTRNNTFLVAVALAFGIGIAVLAFAIAPISGAHINPAVTFSVIILGGLNPVLGLLYIVTQCVGAMLGAALVFGTFASNQLETLSGSRTPPFMLGVNSVTPGVPIGSAFLGEMMGTFLLVFVVIMTASYKHNISANIAPIAIGWAVFLAHLVLIPITGCGVNPARSFGPMVVDLMAGESMKIGWWIFYVAPFVGAGLATIVGNVFFGVSSEGDGIFGPETSEEVDMKELREAEPMMEANILEKLDEEEDPTLDEESGNYES